MPSNSSLEHLRSRSLNQRLYLNLFVSSRGFLQSNCGVLRRQHSLQASCNRTTNTSSQATRSHPCSAPKTQVLKLSQLCGKRVCPLPKFLQEHTFVSRPIIRNKKAEKIKKQFKTVSRNEAFSKTVRGDYPVFYSMWENCFANLFGGLFILLFSLRFWLPS